MAEDDDLVPTDTLGYKPGQKKTIQELQNLDSNDESLKKWKESLGLGATNNATDTRKVIVQSLTLQVEGRPDVVMDLTHLQNIERQSFTMKEGIEYRLCIKFLVQHDVICGLKYMHSVKRSGIKVDKMEEMIGSYGPSTEPYEKKFMPEEAPSGLMARGKYTVKSKFIDDDKVTHLEWTWGLEIKKDWDEPI